ncbi:MAG: serine/threonine protein kinase [Myxococcales bacterium]|nr:serine/threonine protein kinase [Myxococcales bacterium]
MLGADDQALASGVQVGEYAIEAAIGRGGFGSVYRAVHPVIGKQVAIKVLARKYSADADVVSRFVSEARAVNQIGHRNIIDIFAFGQLPDGRHYYVMELLDGEPLDRAIAGGPLALAEALPILRALARALDAAHAKGIAHRDLKPENIFLARDPDGTTFPKLLDFGIAKLLGPDELAPHRTGTGVPLGTPYYMSPEQCRGRDVDHRTDIYSFGIVTYRVLTGAYPFHGDFMELMMKQIGEEPIPPSRHVPGLPPTVDAAIAWMMRKDPAERPPSLIDAVAALDPDSTVTPTPAARRSGQSLPPLGRSTGRGDGAMAQTIAQTSAHTPRLKAHRRWIGAVAVLAIAAAGAWWLTRRGDNEPKPQAVQAPPPPTSVPAPQPAPVVVAPPAPAPASAPVVVAPPAPVVVVPPASAAAAPTRPGHAATKRAIKHTPAGSGSAQTGSAEEDHGDVIHLPDDVFRR